MALTAPTKQERQHALLVGGFWLLGTALVMAPAVICEGGSAGRDPLFWSRPVGNLVIGVTLAGISFTRALVGDDRLPRWVRMLRYTFHVLLVLGLVGAVLAWLIIGIQSAM